MTNLVEHARNTPDRLAYVIGDGEFRETYAELERRSRRVALWMQSLGVAEGDSIALLLGNIEQFFDIYWATQRLGLYLTPINWHLSGSEVSYIVENCEAKLLLVDSNAERIAAEVQQNTASQVRHYCSVGCEIDGYVNMDSELAKIPRDPQLDNQRFGSVMLYSSGTTGRPKGIRKPLPGCDFENDEANEQQTRFIGMFGFREGDAYLCPAPLYHAAPARSCAATHILGGTVYVMHRFDPELALQIIHNNHIQVSQWVPTHFKRMLVLPEETRNRYDISSLRVALHAAAPCPVALKQAMIDWWGPIFTEYYAGSEGGGTMICSDEWLQHRGSVGKPWQGAELAIFDQNGDPVTEPGTDGAIYFRDTLSMGFSYFKDEEKTLSVYRGEYFTLGDIGHVDEQGYLFLTDRQSNMIISGGVNIYPQETEDCLLSHPKVFDVAVIGVPCEEMGEQVKALVIPVDGNEPGDELERELVDFCREQIAHYKAPKSVDFVNELPRTETGKLQKRKLKPLYESK